MRLVAVTLENYRVFDEKTTIALEEGLTLFTGQNGAGKSSILRALDHFFNGFDSFEARGMGYNSRGSSGPVSHNFPILDRTFFFDEEKPIAYITCIFEVSDSDKKHIFGSDKDFEIKSSKGTEVIRWENIGNVLEIVKYFEHSGDDLRSELFSVKLGSITLYTQNEEKAVTIQTGNHGSAFDKDGLKEILPKFVYLPPYRIVHLDNVKADIRETYPDGRGFSRELFDLEKQSTRRGGRNFLKNIQDICKRLCPTSPVNIVGMLVGDDLVSTHIDNRPPLFSADGDVGTVIIAYYLAQENNQILCIDEPEVHLHPKAQREIIRCLFDFSKSRQILLATHSPPIVSEVPISSLRYLFKKGEGGATKHLSGTEITMENLARDLGVEPSDQITGFNACVFVEGPNDIEFWKTVVKKLKEAEEINEDFEDNKIGFVICGGDNLKHWINLKLMKRLNKNFAVIWDSDREEPGHNIPNKLLNWKSKIEEDGGLFFILQKREIENYLHPDAIERSDRELKEYNDYTDMKDIFGENVHKVIKDMSSDEILEMDKYEEGDTEFHELLEIIRSILSLLDPN